MNKSFPKLIFSDFDGTLTNHRGQMTPVFFEILSLISKQKSELVIVTGRSYSWGLFFLTHFPLQNIIVEGGGTLLYKDAQDKIHEHHFISSEEKLKLDQCLIALTQKHPNVEVALDTVGRKTDFALEIFDMSETLQNETRDFLKEKGAHFSQSNVHLNVWFGKVSKAKASIELLQRKKISMEETLYFGDSLNDESMFKEFPNTVGVSNIKSILHALNNKPSIILEGKENAYCEGVLKYLQSLSN